MLKSNYEEKLTKFLDEVVYYDVVNKVEDQSVQIIEVVVGIIIIIAIILIIGIILKNGKE